MTIKKFETLGLGALGDKVPVGTIVYDLKGWDYGLASDDTRFTGVKHVSVTLDPEGDYPSFTIRQSDLKEIP
jgi:hypothetical protein